MAAPPASGLSKAEYLRRRYLEAGGAEAEKKRRRRRKVAKGPLAGGMRIVDDDDTSWKSIPTEQDKEDAEGDDGDLPVVAEFIDERPDEIKWMEEFRTSNKWKLLGGSILQQARMIPEAQVEADRNPVRTRTQPIEGSRLLQDPQMLSGGKAGLVSAELLRKEQQASRKQDGGGGSKQLEAESRHAETIFRDKSGRKRDLKQERLEQQKKAEEKSERDEQYAKWGKGLAQSRQQQQNVEDAVKEMQKPLARYIDDQDLDKMLREQEREGDPMADFLRKKKAKERKDAKDRPKYSGPAPPLNRFNIWPGYRWDGVDRSNGFEQKRFARIASKKAVQELAYKWSVEDIEPRSLPPLPAPEGPEVSQRGSLESSAGCF
ncbi:hypothetical protein EYD10_16334 [Varanus komodoensis]|nr:hypothetical protein EYD10_16334 [Varanus komodoensis]